MFYAIYRHKHEGELPVYCIKHEDFSCYYVFYITTIPYLPCKGRESIIVCVELSLLNVVINLSYFTEIHIITIGFLVKKRFYL